MYSKYAAQLKKVKLFEGMETEDICKVLGCLNAYTKTYVKGSCICIHGDAFEDIGIILSGRVMVNKECQNGSVLTINILEKNDTFGEDIVCLSNSQVPYTLTANENTEILYVKGKKLIDPSSARCEYRSRVNLNMLKRLAEYSMYVNKRMNYMSILSLKKRVAAFLLESHREMQAETFSIGMNREQMADYLNGTRTAISRILIELKREGLIEYHKSTFVIKDQSTLVKMLN